MTVTTQDKLGAYSTHQNSELDGREIDKRALLGCASRLREALDAAGRDMQIYGDAIRKNQRLWTMFQVALCDPENALPRDLKITLLNLSRYVDRTSFRAIIGFRAAASEQPDRDQPHLIATGLAKKMAASAQSAVQHSAEPPAMPAGSVTRSA